MARASAFQAEGRGFESRFPLQTRKEGGCGSTVRHGWEIGIRRCRMMIAHVAQSVEHILGKDEVTSSILVVGSRFL